MTSCQCLRKYENELSNENENHRTNDMSESEVFPVRGADILNASRLIRSTQILLRGIKWNSEFSLADLNPLNIELKRKLRRRSATT